jgi:hypothetical protein
LQQLEPFHLLVDQNPSGGQCTGYCVGNKKTEALMENKMHLKLCYNEATDLQYEILQTDAFHESKDSGSL